MIDVSFTRNKKITNNQKRTIASSVWKVFDKTILVWKTNTTNKRGLPHIAFIKSKTEPLGKQFNNLAYPNTEIMLFLDIQRGNNSKFSVPHTDLNPTTYFCLCIYKLSIYSRWYIYIPLSN